MSDITQARRELVARILGGPGRAARDQRRAAFDNAGLATALDTLVDKVAMHAHRVTDEDIDAAKATGLSEDEIFELVACAAVGQATREYEGALAALDLATGRRGYATGNSR